VSRALLHSYCYLSSGNCLGLNFWLNNLRLNNLRLGLFTPAQKAGEETGFLVWRVAHLPAIASLIIWVQLNRMYFAACCSIAACDDL
jgi:hypothetical protein